MPQGFATHEMISLAFSLDLYYIRFYAALVWESSWSRAEPK